MAKFVMIGCALLVVCAIAEASLFDKIHDAVTSTTSGMETLVNGAVSGVVSGADKIAQGGNQLIHGLSNKTQTVLSDVEKDIESITTKTKISVPPCTALADTLKKVFLSVSLNAGTCITEKVKDTLSESTEIVTIVKGIFNLLLSAGTELLQCASDSGGISGALHTLSCMNGILAKLEWQATTHLPTVLKSIYHVTSLLNGLMQNVTNCVIDDTVNTLVDSSTVVINQIQMCVTERKGTQSTP